MIIYIVKMTTFCDTLTCEILFTSLLLFPACILMIDSVNIMKLMQVISLLYKKSLYNVTEIHLFFFPHKNINSTKIINLMFDDFPYHREKALLLKLMFTLKIVDIFYNACFFPSLYINILYLYITVVKLIRIFYIF